MAIDPSIPLGAGGGSAGGIANAFLAGRDNARATALNEQQVQAQAAEAQAKARSAKLGQLASMAFRVSREPMQTRGALLQQAKAAAAQLYGNDPEILRIIETVTPENVEGYAAGLTGIKEQLDAGKTDAEIAKIYTETQDIGIDNNRADWKTGAEVRNIDNTIANRNVNTQSQIANRAARTGIYGNAPGMQPPAQPLPRTLAQQEQEDIDAIGTASAAVQDLDGIVQLLGSGKVELGPMANFESMANNWLGTSTENSRAYTQIQSVIEKIRNATLMLNKGVQTEGDALRALNEIAANMNDVEVLKQQLTTLRGINARALALRQNNINLRRQNAGFGTIDASGYQAQGSPYGGMPAVQPPPEDDLDSIIDMWAP